MTIKFIAAIVSGIMAMAHAQNFVLHSKAFQDYALVPKRYTCKGQDISPPLAWQNTPPGTKSLALIVDDPDAPDPKAPKTVWVHWVAFNIPVEINALPEDARAQKLGFAEGLNDWKSLGYRGPCPPIGRHRYIFTLYALDTKLALRHPSKSELLKAMQGHILAKTALTGLYQKSGQ